MSEEYATIKLPLKFVEDLIDPVVEDKTNGYGSRAEYIKAAVREFSKDNQPKQEAESTA